MPKIHFVNWTNYERFKVHQVRIGQLKLGGDAPIVIQSMVNTSTLDTESTVNQAIELVDSDCQLVRITAQGVKEAENLASIKASLEEQNVKVPLVADIHFAPKAADVAAKIVDKVRINPGNYIDKKNNKDYTEEEYLLEVKKIEDKFIPFLEICRENNTAVRIGSNHGSLSERIINKYGNTPLGMVEAAMEFLRICKKVNFNQVVVSMKASNTQVMTQATRLLAYKMKEEGLCFPIHLGVTEAGKGEDGIVKSSIGISSLLLDGIGDTIRVSLTEHPKKEIPVAKAIVKATGDIIGTTDEFNFEAPKYYDPFKYTKRKTSSVANIGGHHLPIVISKANLTNRNSLLQADYFFSEEFDDTISVGQLPKKQIVPFDVYEKLQSESLNKRVYPLFSVKDYSHISSCKSEVKFVICHLDSFEDLLKNVEESDSIVLIFENKHQAIVSEQRAFFSLLDSKQVNYPVVLKRNYTDQKDIRIKASCELGVMLVDGFSDGLWIDCQDETFNTSALSFGILQGARLRMSKTEFISCPSCGRTLFDLESTTDRVKKELSHLKSLKIGVMGCIVNGPGEMADADYGYVGAGKGKISLYKGQTLVRKNIPSEQAVKELINLIKENGDWVEP